MFSMAMWMAALVAPVQIFAGDQHGLNTLEYQPAKVHGDGGPLPEPSRRRAADPVRHARRSAEQHVDYAVEIPKLGSLILKHDPNAPLAGLDTVPARPTSRRSAIVFWTFRIMVGLGFAMLGLGLWSLLARWRGRLLRLALAAPRRAGMGPAGSSR